eukprot:88919_1
MGNYTATEEEKIETKQQATTNNEQKYEIDLDDEYDYQEVVVNDSDFRKPIHRCVPHRNLPIVKCIGQIESEFNYKIKHGYKKRAVGTGTVYKVSKNGLAFVASCAHNTRHQIKYCTACDTYNEKGKLCWKCKQKCDKKKVIKATSIEFHRYTITNQNFGELEDSYKCYEAYIPPFYDDHTFAEHGFDFSILMFHDHKNGYYGINCCNIKFDIAVNVLNKSKRFCIFGYPGIDYGNAKKDKLYGYAMKSDAEENGIELIQRQLLNITVQSKEINLETYPKYSLRQRHVDASPGQSGSAVFVTIDDQAIIFAIHVGGHKKNDEKKEDYAFNRATLLNDTYVKMMKNITEKDYELNKRRLYEKEEWKNLDAKGHPKTCALNMKWMSQWIDFVYHKTDVIPPKIDNTNINEGNGKLKNTLIKDVDYLLVSVDIWRFLFSIYEGGPEVHNTDVNVVQKQRRKHDHLLKLLLVGDTGVDKTGLLMSFTSDEFDPDTRSTIGVDLKVKIVYVRGKKIKVTIWDTAGQERFRTLTSAYYRGAQGVILVYDITRKETFDNIKEWLKEVDIFTTKENVIKVLVGNKIHLEKSRQVSREQGANFAKMYNMLFFEASCKTKLGVQDVFMEVIEKILDTPSLLKESVTTQKTNVMNNKTRWWW